jgi:hypothetical protein
VNPALGLKPLHVKARIPKSRDLIVAETAKIEDNLKK